MEFFSPTVHSMQELVRTSGYAPDEPDDLDEDPIVWMTKLLVKILGILIGLALLAAAILVAVL